MRCERITAAAVKDPEFGKQLLARGFNPIGTTTDEWRAHVDREIEKWTKIIAAGGAKPQ